MFGGTRLNPDEFGGNDLRRGTPRFVEANFSYNADQIAAFREFAHSHRWTVPFSPESRRLSRKGRRIALRCFVGPARPPGCRGR